MGTRDELSGSDIDLAAWTALYETHRFCIRLSPDVSLLDDEGVPKEHLDPGTLSVFLHEYTHFSHNVSTTSGWSAYEILLDLVAHFSNLLDEVGACDLSGLDVERSRLIAASVMALNRLDGSRVLTPRPHPSAPTELRVLRVVERRETVSAIGGLPLEIPVVDIYWELTRRDATVESTVTQLGSYLIEEGIAYLLENAVRRRALYFDPLPNPGRTVPLYPYVAYQIVCTALAPAISPLSALRLGLLALNFHRPGHALVRSLDYYHALRNHGRDDNDACERVRQEFLPILVEMLDHVRTKNVQALPTIFGNRGLIEDGAKQVQRWFLDGLSSRRDDIWYDLGWCSGPYVDLDALGAFIRANTPCDVIQERGGPDTQPERDALLAFDTQGRISKRDRSGVRALQAQFDFMLSHLTLRGFRSTADGGGRRCPYFTSCTLPLRRAESEVCARQPWTLWQRTRTCWYGSAVAGTIGFVTHLE